MIGVDEASAHLSKDELALLVSLRVQRSCAI